MFENHPKSLILKLCKRSEQLLFSYPRIDRFNFCYFWRENSILLILAPKTNFTIWGGDFCNFGRENSNIYDRSKIWIFAPKINVKIAILAQKFKDFQITQITDSDKKLLIMTFNNSSETFFLYFQTFWQNLLCGIGNVFKNLAQNSIGK